MNARHAVAGMLALVTVITTGALAAQADPGSPSTPAATPSPRVPAADQARALTEPLSCIDRTDATDARSPLFHGCIDWHSAVHAHYALYAATRITGDPQYAARADASLDPARFPAELEYMRRTVTGSRYDNPYGYAWFLLLAMERERVTGRTDLRPLADYAAGQVAARLPRAYARQPEYSNQSIPALQLARWAKHTGNATLAATARRVVEASIRPVATSCSLTANDWGFLPTCPLAVAAVAEVEGEAAKLWLAQRLAGYHLTYRDPSRIPDRERAHNFVRAYAIGVAADVAGMPGLRDEARGVVARGVQDAWVWRESYATRSHWIAQTGMLALAELTPRA